MLAMNGVKRVDLGLALFAKIKDFFFQFLKWIFMVEGLIHFWVSNFFQILKLLSFWLFLLDLRRVFSKKLHVPI